MGKAKDPPRFSLDKPYEQWKTEIRLWQLEQADDNTDTAKHAMRIALDMPEEGFNYLRARILAGVTLYDTAADGKISANKDAFKNLIAFLDKEFKKDDILQMCNYIDAWLDTSKANITASRTTSPPSIMPTRRPRPRVCRRCPRGAQLDDKDHKFVNSNVNVKDKPTLYAKTKEAMLKFFGR